MSTGIGFDFGFGKKKAVQPQPNAAEYTPPDSLKYVQPVNEPEPDWEDVRQQYPEHSAVTEIPVTVDKPIKAWNLPAKRSVMHSYHVPAVGTGAIAIELIPADPRIKNAYIVSDSNNPGAIYLGTREQVSMSGGAGGDPYFYNGSNMLGPWQGFQEPVYAIAQTGTSVNIVNVRLEFWAD